MKLFFHAFGAPSEEWIYDYEQEDVINQGTQFCSVFSFIFCFLFILSGLLLIIILNSKPLDPKIKKKYQTMKLIFIILTPVFFVLTTIFFSLSILLKNI